MIHYIFGMSNRILPIYRRCIDEFERFVSEQIQFAVAVVVHIRFYHTCLRIKILDVSDDFLDLFELLSSRDIKFHREFALSLSENHHSKNKN